MITVKGITLLERNKLLPFSRVLFILLFSLVYDSNCYSSSVENATC